MWESIPPGTSAEYRSTVGSLRVARLEQVAHRFGSDKLYICLSNKCFKVYPVYLLCTDIRPSQDHRILRMQTVQINLANTTFHTSWSQSYSFSYNCNSIKASVSSIVQEHFSPYSLQYILESSLRSIQTFVYKPVYFPCNLTSSMYSSATAYQLE